MSTSVGDLAVNISANIASLETGMAKAADVVNRAAAQMAASVATFNSGIETVIGSFTKLAGIAGIGLGVGAFAGMIASAIAGQAELSKLSERTGATVESLSAMRTAAKYAGVSMDEVATGLQKFAKSVVAAQDGTSKQARAFASLGLDAKTLVSQYKTTDEAFLAVAKRINDYGLSLTKTADLQTIFSRSGANLAVFLREVAERGLDNVKVTTEQAKAAKALEDSITKLKQSFTNLINAIATNLVPVLQKVIDGFGTFKSIAIAAFAAFVVLPAVIGTVGTAINAVVAEIVIYREAVLAAAAANAVLGTSLAAGFNFSALSGKLFALPAAFTSGWQAAIVGVGALIFAAFAGWKIGEWLEENFFEAKVAGAYFVDWMLTAWENVKYGALVAWETIKLGFNTAFGGMIQSAKDVFSAVQSVWDTTQEWLINGFEYVAKAASAAWTFIKDSWTEATTFMQGKFGNFLQSIGAGLEKIPGVEAAASAVADFAESLFVSTNSAVAPAKAAVGAYVDKIAELGVANTKAKASIHAITDDMKLYAVQVGLLGTKTSEAAKGAPPVPEAHVKAVADMTKALDAYQKALAAVAKASVDSQAKAQLEAISIGQDQVKRLYDRGIIDFQHFWDAKTALQQTALGVEEARLQDDVDIQQRLVESLQAVINNIDPSKFKTYAEYQKVIYDESAKLLTAFAGLIKVEGDLNIVRQKGAEIGKGYIEALIAESNGHLKSIKSLDDEIVKRIEDNAAIGLTQSQVIALTIARVEERKANADLSGPEGATLLQFYDDQIDRLHKLADATSAGENKARLVAGWQDLFKGAADAGSKFLVDFVQHGGSAFKNLWNDFKTWALEALAKIAAQKIIVAIAGSIGLGGIATNALADQGGPLGSILGGGGGGLGGLSSLFGGGSALSGIGSAIGGAFGSALGAGFGAGLSTLTIAAEAGTAAVGGTAAALGALGAVAIPVVGWIAAAGVALYSIFQANKKPSEVKGQFGISPTDTGFEDSVSTSSKFGFLGFLDAQTQQFSGEAAQAFNKIVSGALDAFAGRMSAEQQSRLAEILQKTTFPTMEGTFTTEDFLQKYGGQVLQQVVQAAFDVLDPAFGSVVANFKGTADEIAGFGNTLLAIYDISKDFSTDFKANITGALADATQETADKVLAFVGIFAAFGNSISGLGEKMQGLDPGAITAFVDALGGAAKAVASFAYLGQNFTTTADKMKLAVDRLTADFTKLGVSAIPQTHAQFLALLSSFDLTTDAGRQLYASVLALAQEFVAVHGTADDAAKAVNGQADANKRLADSTAFFNENFYSDAEKSAQGYAEDLRQVNAVQTALGITIPTTVAGFRALIEATLAAAGADSDLYQALIVLAPAIFDLSRQSAAAVTQVDDLSDSIGSINPAVDARSAVQRTVDDFLQQIGSVAGQLAGGMGDKLTLQINLLSQRMQAVRDKIDYFNSIGDYFNADTFSAQLALFANANQRLVAQLAEFTTLKAQYGDAIAGQLIDLENWYTGQQEALAGNAEALGALSTIFYQRWAAIIAGMGDGVDGAISELDRLRKSIADYLKSLRLSDISPLTPAQKLAQAKADFEAEFAKAQGGDLAALGDITKYADAYLKLARDAFASSQQYTDIFNLITGELGGLANTDAAGNPIVIPDMAAPFKPVVDKFAAAVDNFAIVAASFTGKEPNLGALLPLPAPTLPTPPAPDLATTSLVAALPANGSKMASKEDVSQQTKEIIAALFEGFKAHADAGTEDATAVATAVNRGAVQVVDAVKSGLK